MASKRPFLSLVALSHCGQRTIFANETTNESESESEPESTDTTRSRTSGSDHVDVIGVSNPADSSSSDDDTSAASSTADDGHTSFYKNAHWTHDGTTIITCSWANQISSHLIPEHLLEPRDYPLTLQPHWTLTLATPTNVVASAPYYDIRCPNTDHILVASQDHPLQLYQTGSPARTTQHAPIASYHFKSPTTEAYYPIHSLAWATPGTYFYVGTRDLIAQFDVTRNGDGPSSQTPTIPSRRHIRKGNGVGMRGTVSALTAQTTADGAPTGLLAAGTWTRWVGLYDMARSGECTATWSIAEAAASVVHNTDPAPPLPPPPPAPAGADQQRRRCPAKGTSPTGTTHAVKGIGGAGIMQTAWSPCGRYLLLNERQSTGLLVYDVRGTNKVLGFLAGRDARTQQRLRCDVFPGLAGGGGGFEVWAGARDGTVQVWEGVGRREGCQWPSWAFSVADGAGGSAAPGVGSVALHHSGSVVATCAGSLACDAPWTEGRRLLEGSSLKLWSIGASGCSSKTEAAVIEPGQGDAAMEEEVDELELRRQRVLSTLGTAEIDDSMPSSHPGAGSGSVRNSGALEDIAGSELTTPSLLTEGAMASRGASEAPRVPCADQQGDLA